MAVNPTSGVPSGRINLTQPIGARGLPLTFVLSDSKDDTFTGDVTGFAVTDQDLWLSTASGSGTLVNPAPKTPRAAVVSTPTPLPPDYRAAEASKTYTGRFQGITLNTAAGVVNAEMGSLEFGQAVQDLSDAEHGVFPPSPTATRILKNSYPYATWTQTDVGRYVQHPTREYSSARPGNHTWQQDRDGVGRFVFAGDYSCGQIRDYPVIAGGDGRWAGGKVSGVVHYSKVDLPSNGLGSSFGDGHNSAYLTVLGSSAISGFGSNNGIDQADSVKMDGHWALNLGVRQRVLASGVTLSAPDGCPQQTYATAKDLLGSATIQHLFVQDSFNAGGANDPANRGISYIGRTQYGNHVVADTCGLVGYEGVFTATAFFSIAKDADPDGATTGQVSKTDQLTFAGLNIEVHSGRSLRRNGEYSIVDSQLQSPYYRYGTDGSHTQPMMAALKTRSDRQDSVFVTTEEANLTTFSVLRNEMATVFGGQPAPTVGGTWPVNGLSGITNGKADAILGESATGGQDWNKTATLSSAFLSEKIPTRVRIIPSIIGYEDVIIPPGPSKLARYPTATPLTFKKPIVDYHVLLSVAPRTNQIVKSNLDAAAFTEENGDPTVRNNPNPKRLHTDADFSETGAVIYHAVFRINPDTLEQVWFEPSEAPATAHAPDGECITSVMPRHTLIDETVRCDMGWGLHQVTPFRPLASRDFEKVPRLCGAIEPGGFYQRGGVSHLFDAAAYGGELFVSADTLVSSDLGEAGIKDGQAHFGKVWGHGQIWPNGTATAAMPPGQELLVFRYTPHTDPYHPNKKQTTKTDNPLHNALSSAYAVYVQGDTAFNTALRTGFTITDPQLLNWAGWNIHDWVMPQIELMRYLGREDKGLTTFPNQQHPTLHCSSLRIFDDGQMKMLAVQRDFIGAVDEFPTSDVGYPPNPDIGRTQCPPGYYASGGQCVAISTAAGDLPAGSSLDPTTGQAVPGSSPSPVQGSDGETPTGDPFGDYPSWSKLIANTHARSVILLWNPIKAVAGKIARNYQPFEVRYEEIATGGGNRETLTTQTWSEDKGWWSGARIAWWYEESGQRAIPLTYGCYPESRASHATLPQSLPFILASGDLAYGFPMIQPSITAAPSPNVKTTATDEWFNVRTEFLKKCRFIPTTYGLADFGAGSNPLQEFGWSGWSFPAGLYDPIGYGDGTQFFQDSTTKAKWAEVGGVRDVPYSTAAYGFSYFQWDLTSVPANWEFQRYRINGIEYTLSGGIFPPFVGAIDVALVLSNGFDAPEWETLVEQPFNATTGNRGTYADGTYLLIRPYAGTAPAAPDRLVFVDPTGVQPDFKVYPTDNTNKSIGSMRGPLAGVSYHGPLHYGVSKTNHPYKVDRVWKQVHAGVGYDLPLPLLVPGQVHVRARAGSSNSLDLEIETPFHRTDRDALAGGADVNSGFSVGVTDVPGGARSTLGQWYLRTNLWAGPSSNTPTFSTAGVFDFERIHGPSVSGSPLYNFWSDHPTEHFHAGAIPILPNTDYDLAMIETSRYVPATLKTVDRLSDLDALAVSEQLLSTVDVHVAKSTKPMWDSGSIVTGQALGVTDTKSSKATPYRNEIATSLVWPTVVLASSTGNDVQGLGKGQRSVRTPDGTLHTFFLRRGALVGATGSNDPFWTHYKKPLHGDLFWNKKSLRSLSPDTDTTYTGADQCGPDLTNLGTDARVLGAAFASDSKGTIHAVIQVHADPSNTGNEKSHRLYYHYAERKQVAANPEPVYDWDWTIHTPIIIQQALDVSDPAAAGSAYDFRQPSLVCDSQDRLHLVCQQVWNDASTTSTTYSGYGVSRILYAIKQTDEDNFPDYTQTDSPAGRPNDERWIVVSYTMATIQHSITEANNPNQSRHSVQNADHPKICLRSDDVPVVFYRGASPNFMTAARRQTAVYVNYGRVGDSAGGFTFENQSCHVVGLGPDSHNTGFPNNVWHYDAIIDERDRCVVVSTLDDSTTGGTPAQTYAPRHTYLTTFDARSQPADQYSTTNGLGITRTLLKAPVYDGTTETRYIDPKYRDVVLTTNGKGELHIILGFRLTGHDPNRVGATFRDLDGLEESGIAPLNWPATPNTQTAATAMYNGGYAEQSTVPDWPDGSPYNAPANYGVAQHFMHIWLPSIEYDQEPTADDWVIRSMNIKWLSVPSLEYDATLGWQPIGSAQTGSGSEDFPHFAPQLRYQRWHGFNAGELDLTWMTNEQSWMVNQHEGSRLFMPSVGGVSFAFGGTVGQGIPGYPNGA